MNTENTSSEIYGPVRHPLLQSCTNRPYKFGDWLELWRQSSDVNAKIGQIHGLRSQEFWISNGNDFEDMVCFLLEVADGHLSHLNFKGYVGSANWHDLQKISQMAFKVLCDCYFAAGAPRSSGLWHKHVTTADDWLIERVLWFFRKSPGTSSRIENCSRNCEKAEDARLQGIVKDFLCSFAACAWPASWHETGRWVSFRPRAIEFLDYYEELAEFLSNKELDAPSIEKLNQIVFSRPLRQQVWDDRLCIQYERIPKSLNEALLGGSQAAQALLNSGIVEVAREAIRSEDKAKRLAEEGRKKALELEKLQAQQELIARRQAELQA